MNQAVEHTLRSSHQRWSSILLLTAGLSLLLATLFTGEEAPADWTGPAIVLALLAMASVYDITGYRIPNPLLAAGAAVALVALALDIFPWMSAMGAALGIVFVMLLLRWGGVLLFGKPGFGMGDIKLCFVLALYVQGEIYWLLYLSLLLAGSFAAIGLYLGILSRDRMLPFAPFVLGGTIIGMFWLPWAKIGGWWI